MRPHLLIVTLALAALIATTGARSTSTADTTTTATLVRVVETKYQGKTAREWHAWYRHRTRQLQAARSRVAHLRQHWHPTVDYALRLASAVSGVSYWELRAVAWCESRYDPFAANGRYLGLFQLGWVPFGMSPYDPVANALSAALTVAGDGSWRQWTCQP